MATNEVRVKNAVEKPFVCETCKKCFTSSSNLGRHKRSHSNGEKILIEMV